MPAAEAFKITAEEYRMLPEGGPRDQRIEGELHRIPSPTEDHQDNAGNLLVIIHSYLREHPIGKVFVAPFGVYLTEHDVHQPDALFVSNRRRSIIEKDGVKGAPDFVAEVLSPGTSRIDRTSRRQAYATAGVPELWFVDPRRKTIGIFRLQDAAEKPLKVHSANSVFSSPTFPGLKFRAAEIFRG
jgi:Uma2 family endonuclease